MDSTSRQPVPLEQLRVFNWAAGELRIVASPPPKPVVNQFHAMVERMAGQQRQPPETEATLLPGLFPETSEPCHDSGEALAPDSAPRQDSLNEALKPPPAKTETTASDAQPMDAAAEFHPAPDVPTPQVPHPASIADSRRVATVAAVTRSIESAAMARDLADLVVELCESDTSRQCGPWRLNVPLARQGLGTSMLLLDLSLDTLAMRIDCANGAIHKLLEPRLEDLRAELAQRLAPELTLTIELSLT